MPLRITGMNSGLDTESIITELVKAKKTKVDNTKKEQTKLQWKQDAWKELNTKLLNLYQKTCGTLRFSTAYMKKKTTSSNANAVSVVTGENAVNGVQSINVDKLAKTGYLTGDQLSTDKSYTKDTKLSEIKDENGDLMFDGAGSISVTIDGKTTDISLSGDTTIGSVVSQLQSAGVNANFDENNQRLFISAKKSGAANDFSITANDLDGSKAMEALGIGSKAKRILGQDAEITLNEATFKSATNTFQINGLTITAQAETTEAFALTTQDDTDGIYDTIKNFIKEYNSLVNEMDKLYNAESAKGYEPLTDEEKDEMSDSEIEKWEEKIKASILRRDSTLSSVASGMKSAMAEGVEVNGKKMYLSDFGVNTLSYFLSAENEKYAYHIDGDVDDSNTSGNADKLKSMIASDPETVTSFFTGLANNLYTTMSKLSSSVDGYRSYNSFYYDKKMKEDYSNYTKKISELEDKLTAYEDKWYDKFSAMETALSKLQSSESSLSSLLGG